MGISVDYCAEIFYDLLVDFFQKREEVKGESSFPRTVPHPEGMIYQ